jgi:hypothetical protein
MDAVGDLHRLIVVPATGARPEVPLNGPGAAGDNETPEGTADH